MTRYVYDTGALIAAEANCPRFKLIHRRAMKADELPLVPGPVLVQAWRGGARSAPMARVLNDCEIVIEYAIAEYKRAGMLLGAATLPRRKRPDAVDALVVITAAALQADAIVTSDPKDIEAYADAIGFEIEIVAI